LQLTANIPYGTVKKTRKFFSSRALTAVTKDKICEAAIRIASRDGLLAMTLENVARETGITKGGVMYHFPSKDELIRGVLEYFSQQCETMLMRRVIDDPEPRMRWARCMLDCLFPRTPENSPPNDVGADVLARFFVATLAGAVTSPGAMQPLRDLATRMRNRCLSDPRDGMEQLLVWLTIDGLLLWQFMGLIGPDDPLILKVAESLRARIAAQMQLSSSPEEIISERLAVLEVRP
jgi:AcrR family transcriptional regulator